MKKVSLTTYRRIKNLLEKTSNYRDVLMLFFVRCATEDTEHFIEFKLKEKELFKAEIVEQLIEVEKFPEFLCNYHRRVTVNWADVRKQKNIRCDAHIRSVMKMADVLALKDYKLILTDLVLPQALRDTLVSHCRKLDATTRTKKKLSRPIFRLEKHVLVWY